MHLQYPLITSLLVVWKGLSVRDQRVVVVVAVAVTVSDIVAVVVATK